MNLHIPGSRVVIRDEEWLIRRADPSTDGGQLLTCDGVSDLVRGRSSLFLTRLEAISPSSTRPAPNWCPTAAAPIRPACCIWKASAAAPHPTTA